MEENKFIETYKEKIKIIFKDEPDPANGNPGIRWAFEPIKKETKYLILGINPSNSLKMVNDVIRKSGDKWPEGEFINQYNYDKFLSDPNNEPKILLLQKLAHQHHTHFEKHRKFAEKLELDSNYQFFDLFPVWGIKQRDFVDKLTNDEKKESIKAFKDLIDSHKNIECLLFFNAGAANFFMKQNKTKWDSKEKVNVREDDDRKGPRNSIFQKGKIKLKNREIDVHSFGIGGTLEIRN